MTIASEGITRRKLVLVILLFALPVVVPSLALGQEAPRFDVFGGYSYLRFDSPSIGIADYSNLSGWNAGATFNIKRRWGVAVDFSGHYGSELHLYNFMIGPQYTWRREKSKFFVHGLIGKAQNRVENVVQPGRIGVESVGRAFAAGGGYDIDVSPRFSIRVFQADYLNTSTFGTTQSDVRVSTGVVVHFGHIGHKRRL